jgi:hypothetical protein
MRYLVASIAVTWLLVDAALLLSIAVAVLWP